MKIRNGKIYKITNLINGKMYIGLTTEPISVRWSGHKSYCKTDNNIYLYNSMNKYGIENFKIEAIITGIKSMSELYEMEKLYIKKYNTFKNGYNLTLGGEGTVGYRHTEETKDKIRQAHLGRKLSPKHREVSLETLIFGSNPGKDHPSSIGVYQICKKTGQVIKYHESINLAEKAMSGTGKRSGSINKVVNGHRKSAYGYYWKTKEQMV